MDAQGRYHGFLLTPGGLLRRRGAAMSINDVSVLEGNNQTTGRTFTVSLSERRPAPCW
jgi:hypothetical protein